ncbi:MAG: DUF4249 domain-containing protein [Daejeonella sp.]
MMKRMPAYTTLLGERLYFGPMLLLLVIFSSCEKVINPRLTEGRSAVVIEGGITDQLENQVVRVSKTISFNQSNTFNGVKGAKVTVISSQGQIINFPAAADGIYRSSSQVRGVPGTTYKLEVTVEGKVYTATSILPSAVRPDSITFKRLSIFGNSRVYPAIYYKDPGSVQNQYRYIIRLNNRFIVDLVTEDRFNNGNSTSDLITFEGDGVQKGDKVEIEMQSIDRNVFKYYYAISQISANSGPPIAPSNPDSNLDNGALGIFSAYTRTNLTVTLK